jgi:DNA processing protein
LTTFSPSASYINQLRYWLALYLTPSIGPRRFFQLLEIFPEIESIFHASFAQLSGLGLSDLAVQALQQPDWDSVEKNLVWADQPNQHILTFNDVNYPPLLKQIVGGPPLLFIKGDVQLLKTQQLAIVGSRNPSPTGTDMAYQFAQALAMAGLTITSGLALGIDAASHQGALDSGGKTSAVLGSGLDIIYPRAHQKLADQIAAEGALVSEYPLGTAPKPAHFPQRNRLVCGLSLGVLVVEATLKSGSLITARLAAEQGREVFAIPGSIHNPLARGCHLLIRQGAKLVETTQDILEELEVLVTASNNISATFSKNRQEEDMDEAYQALLNHIGFETTTMDQLVMRTGFAVKVIASMLLVLELKGLIYHRAGGYSRR